MVGEWIQWDGGRVEQRVEEDFRKASGQEIIRARSLPRPLSLPSPVERLG